jgi:hypothetical protein
MDDTRDFAALACNASSNSCWGACARIIDSQSRACSSERDVNLARGVVFLRGTKTVGRSSDDPNPQNANGPLSRPVSLRHLFGA